MKYFCVAIALLLTTATAGTGTPALPGDSIYQLKVELTAADGSTSHLDQLRGHPVLIAMFYASCNGVCPTLAFTMRKIDEALTTEERSALRCVMVSFDPERDDVQNLKEFAHVNKLEDPRWMVARTSPSTVRDLAAVLGVRYLKLPDQTFGHSTNILMLNADGVIEGRTSKLGELDPDFMRIVSATIAGGAKHSP